MLAKLLPHNESTLDRGIRVVLGLGLLAIVFVGPQTWWGLVGPAGLSRELTGRLHQAFAGALQQPEVKARFAALMAEPVANTPEQFGAFMRQELAKYEGVVKASGAKVD